ncbi:MAG: hypothetical protein HW391_707 [Chloroflexi bacterium]|nr:hypothetical protein [Chloroflexota bacterium]
MSSHRSRRTLAVTGALALLTLVTAGCGRRDLAADGLVASAPPAGVVASASTTGVSDPGTGQTVPAWTSAPAPSATAEQTGTPASAATQAPAATQSAPLATPDLTAIEQLLDDLDAALGADATADTDEGSSK